MNRTAWRTRIAAMAIAAVAGLFIGAQGLHAGCPTCDTVHDVVGTTACPADHPNVAGITLQSDTTTSSTTGIGKGQKQTTTVHTQSYKMTCKNACDEETSVSYSIIDTTICTFCDTTGDPVVMPSGQYLDDAVDLRLACRGGVVQAYRRYGAFNDVNGVLGRGWESVLHKTLSVAENGDVDIFYEGGSVLHFVKNGDATYTRPGWSYVQLSKLGSDYVCTYPSGEKWYFDGTQGVRTKSADANGNLTTYQYDLTQNMTGMTDPAQRQYAFLYDGGGRLTALTDFSGRSVLYQYDLDNDVLTKVTRPYGPGGGLGVSYAYYGSGPAQYKMSTRTVGDKTSPDLTLYYDATIRVTRQTTGGVGDYVWAYGADGVITQTDRAGNSQLFCYDGPGGRMTREIVETNRDVRPGEGNYETGWLYDPTAPIATSQTLPSGSDYVKLSDANGNLTKRTITRDGASLSESSWFDVDNNRISRQDHRGYTTRFSYDANHNLLTSTTPTVAMGQPSVQASCTTYAYDGTGQVTRQVNPNGVVTASFYDGNGVATRVIVDEGGLNLVSETSYDQFGNTTLKVSPEGNRTFYYYDGGSLLTKEARVLDNSDPSKQYAVSYWYDPAGKVASKKVEHKDQTGAAMTPAEYVVEYLYDVEGRATREVYDVDATNRITRSYLYNGEGAISAIVNPNGTQEGYVLDERNLVYQKVNCGGCGSTTISFSIDGTGQVTKRVDAVGNSTVMAYDGFERMTRTSYYDHADTPALLSYEEVEYDGNENVTRRTIRDASDAILARTTYCYDEVNRLYDTRSWANPSGAEGDDDARTTYLYDVASRLTKQKTYLSGTDASPVVAETSYYYDNAGRQTLLVDAEGGAIGYVYDKDGRMTQQTDAEGKTSAFLYDRMGRVTRQTDAAGNYLVMQHDSFGGVLTRANYSAADAALAKAAEDYDGLARVTLSRRFADPSGADDGKDYKVVAYYDGNGLVTKSVDPLGNATTSFYDSYNRLQWKRDPLGNKLEYTYDANNNVVTTLGYELDMVNGATKSFAVAQAYDGLNRVTASADQGKDGDITQAADNGVTATYYDALNRKTKTTDAEGVSTTREYQAFSLLTRLTDDLCGFNRHTDRGYDRAGRMTRITDDLSQSTDYVYDKLSRVTRTSYALANDIVDQVYDKTGAMTKRLDQRGISTLYLYDDLHRLTKKQDDPSSPTIVETYALDALGRMTLAQLARSGTAQSDVRYYYDGLSRATRESQSIQGGTARNVDSSYDPAGNRLTLNYPGGKSVAYTYDADNRVSLILDGTNARAQYLYIGPSRRSQVELLNGANTVSTLKNLYDGVARITSALYRNAADTDNIIGFQHAYDKVGNPQYEVRVHQASYGDAYFYDSLYRLTRVIYDDSNPASPSYDVARTEDFGLDSIGNRTTIYAKSGTGTTYLHNPVNEYTTVGGDTYLYDAAGNLTKDASFLYYWDYENRLTKVKKVSDSSDVAEYTYDAMMRRIEKTDYSQYPIATTRFYEDAWSDIEERDGNDTLTATYVNGMRIDEYVTMTRNGTEYWYMQSPLIGNVAALVNSTGAIQDGYTYTAYGTATVHTGAGADGLWFTADDVTSETTASSNRFTFTGRRYDPETQLMYFRMRAFAPLLGAFASRDPADYQDGMNLSSYAQMSPARFIDPTGLACQHRVQPNSFALNWVRRGLGVEPGRGTVLTEAVLEVLLEFVEGPKTALAIPSNSYWGYVWYNYVRLATWRCQKCCGNSGWVYDNSHVQEVAGPVQVPQGGYLWDGSQFADPAYGHLWRDEFAASLHNTLDQLNAPGQPGGNFVPACP